LSVDVIWGVDSTNYSIDERLQPVWYTPFDLTDPVAQQYFLDVQDFFLFGSGSLVDPNCAPGTIGCTCINNNECEDDTIRCGPVTKRCTIGFDGTSAVTDPDALTQLKDSLSGTNSTWPLPSNVFTRQMYNFANQRSNIRSNIGFKGPKACQPTCEVAWIIATIKSVQPVGLSSFAADAFYKRWITTIDYINENPPSSLGPANFFSGDWVEMETEIQAVQGVLLGFVLSVITVFASLLIFTANIVVAIWAILTLMLAMAVVMSMFVILGWGLGIIEALSASILVGLADFYVFHIAEAYVETPPEDSRNTRLRQAVTRIGSSILSGSLTVFIACGALLFCKLQIFIKFGAILAANTAVTIYFSMFLLTSLLSLWGPTRKFGDIPFLVKVRHMGESYIVPGKTRIDPAIFEGSKAAE
jgi:hypothetical protein